MRYSKSFLLLACYKKAYWWQQSTAQGKMATSDIYLTEVPTMKNLCTKCGVDMGDCNPRQLCGKTRCYNEELVFHADGEEGKTKDSGNAVESFSSSSLAVPADNRKRKFLSSHEFNERADDKTKRRIAPIQKWRDLIVGSVYRADKLHDILVNIKGTEQLNHYGEFHNDQGLLTNVWLTETMYEKLKTFKLEERNVYLKPLGKKRAQVSGNDYHDFVVVVDE